MGRDFLWAYERGGGGHSFLPGRGEKISDMGLQNPANFSIMPEYEIFPPVAHRTKMGATMGADFFVEIFLCLYLSMLRLINGTRSRYQVKSKG